jgi:hypothetical protein
LAYVRPKHKYYKTHKKPLYLASGALRTIFYKRYYSVISDKIYIGTAIYTAKETIEEFNKAMRASMAKPEINAKPAAKP